MIEWDEVPDQKAFCGLADSIVGARPVGNLLQILRTWGFQEALACLAREPGGHRLTNWRGFSRGDETSHLNGEDEFARGCASLESRNGAL